MLTDEQLIRVVSAEFFRLRSGEDAFDDDAWVDRPDPQTAVVHIKYFKRFGSGGSRGIQRKRLTLNVEVDGPAADGVEQWRQRARESAQAYLRQVGAA